MDEPTPTVCGIVVGTLFQRSKTEPLELVEAARFQVTVGPYTSPVQHRRGHLARLPSVIAITATLLMIYSLYRLRPTAPGTWAWPVIFALLTLYGIVAALAPGDGTSRGVLPSMGFATLAVYTWLDSAGTTLASHHRRTARVLRRSQSAAHGVGYPMAQTERALVVKRIPKGTLAATPVGEGTRIFELSEAQARYAKADGWSLVSHTFKMPAESSTVLS